jgi:hypothetical protein
MLRMEGEGSDVEFEAEGQDNAQGEENEGLDVDEISTLRADSTPLAASLNADAVRGDEEADADHASSELDAASDSDSGSDSESDSDESSETSTDDSEVDSDDDDDDEEDLDRLLAAAKLSAQRRAGGVSGENTPSITLDGAGAETAGFGEESVLRLDSLNETKDA